MNKNSLFLSIVDRGRAEDILKELRVFGIDHGFVIHGEGTVSNKILKFLGLDDTEKDIVGTTILSKDTERLHLVMEEHFNMDKKNKGIAFSVPLSHFARDTYLQSNEVYKSEQFQYHCLFAIVKEGEGRTCVDLAKSIGVYGGTIIHGRGRGVRQKAAFDLVLQPNEDIVMIISFKENLLKVKDLIKNCQSANSQKETAIFILPVSHVTGIYKEEGK